MPTQSRANIEQAAVLSIVDSQQHSFRHPVATRLIGCFGLVASLCTAAFDVQAQAGSRAPLYFQTPDVFYHSLNATGSGPRRFDAGGPVVPDGAWMVAPSTRFLLWVELEYGRLNVIENVGEAGLVLRKRIPISIGKQGIGKRTEGDNKTPIGIYRIADFLADSQLDDIYGTGAYPLDYPNAWDRLHGRSGHGIWLHGLPKAESERPFLTSEGCVVIDNTSLLALADEVTAGETLILLSADELRWVPQQDQLNKAHELRQALADWEQSWEARDSEHYLSFYADDFSDLRRNKAAWAAYKRELNAGKRFIDVELNDISMLVEPTAPGVVKVLFHEGYRSDDYQWQGHKEQLWRYGPEGWKIIYEGEA